jgi:hypothetical protein
MQDVGAGTLPRTSRQANQRKLLRRLASPHAKALHTRNGIHTVNSATILIYVEAFVTLGTFSSVLVKYQ